MNGKDMLEAMGFVDEKYVQAAASPAWHRRRYWPGVAAAACAVLIVGAGLIALRLSGQEPATEEFALSAAPAEDSAVYSGAEESAEIALGGALTSGSTAPLEMTVRVLEQTGETLRCVVEDPGTGSYTAGQEITVVLDSAETALSSLSRSSESSEKEAAPYSEDAEDSAEDAAEETAAEEILWIQYTPGEEESTVTAIDWSFASEDGDS